MDPFTKWFGQSVVKNLSDGSPLRCYRGTRRAGDLQGRLKLQSYTDSYDVASIYAATPPTNLLHAEVKEGASVTPVYLSIQNPLALGVDYESAQVSLRRVLKELRYPEGDGITHDEVMKLLRHLHKRTMETAGWSGADFKHEVVDIDGNIIEGEFTLNPNDLVATPIGVFAEDFDYTYWAIWDEYNRVNIDAYALADAPVLRRVAERMGYDGFIHLDVFHGNYHAEKLLNKDREDLEGVWHLYPDWKEPDWDEEEPVHLTYRPFSQTQVKSVFNDGTWNPDDPDILRGG